MGRRPTYLSKLKQKPRGDRAGQFLNKFFNHLNINVMILFGFILMMLMYVVSIALASTYIIDGYKERDGFKILLGVLLAITGTGPSGYLAWIFWPHI